MKNKKHGKIIAIVSMAIILVLLIVNASVENSYFNPYSKEEASYPFHVITQLVSPSVSYSYASKSTSSTIPFMSFHEQDFAFDQFPEHSQKTKGILKYRFGKVTVENYDDAFGFGELTCKQSIFTKTESSVVDIKSIDESKNYEVWFGLKNPLTNEDFAKKYGWLLDNSISRPKNAGLMWLAIKTTDNDDEVCLGGIGNQSVHYLINPVFNIHYGNSMTIYDCYDIFYNALSYLKSKPDDTKMYLDSGLFKDAENIDFGQRLEYVNENGAEYIGMTGYMGGDNIAQLAADGELNIVKLIERE